jgi:hypothetical protein
MPRPQSLVLLAAVATFLLAVALGASAAMAQGDAAQEEMEKLKGTSVGIASKKHSRFVSHGRQTPVKRMSVA